MARRKFRTRSFDISPVRLRLHFLLHVYVRGLDFPVRLFSVYQHARDGQLKRDLRSNERLARRTSPNIGDSDRANVQGPGKLVKDDRLETTFKALEGRLQEVLSTRIARNYSLDDVLDLANHHAALWVLHDELLQLRALLVDLPLPGDSPRRDKQSKFCLPRIDMSRVRDGVKPAVAATGALLLCDWFNPPGAVGIPLGAMMLTILNKNFVGGKGDRGSLQGAFNVSVAELLFVLLVFLISPALSNYSVMNLFLFAQLFAFGYYSASLGGQNLHQSAALFFIAATVNLDAERPVAVQTVFGSYFGVALAIFIAAIVVSHVLADPS